MSLIKHDWRLDEVMDLFQKPLNDLLFEAHSVFRNYFDPNAIQLCTLLSIKTGKCPENCRYCAQSARYKTNIENKNFMEIEDIVEAAMRAKSAGASRFCMGAAWRSLRNRDLDKLAAAVKEVKKLGLEACLSAGMATLEQLQILKQAGLDFYNHNIDTSEDFYHNIITTRTYQDRLDTIKNVCDADIKTCSGGIVGMGESVADRAKMLMTLANLENHPVSVPINRLVPIEGTPLAEQEKIENFDFIRTVAVARIMMPRSFVRLAAGRETMSEEMQALCFFAGANSIFYGEKLLTTGNPAHESDRAIFARLGLETLGA
ncbi:biotin synthase [Rickettsiales bacterium]|nr:biotin synthase [Rickettsiales bacterium]